MCCREEINEQIRIRDHVVQVETITNLKDVLNLPIDFVKNCILLSTNNKSESEVCNWLKSEKQNWMLEAVAFC